MWKTSFPLFALSIAISGPALSAEAMRELDVVIKLDQALITEFGREKIDRYINEQIGVSDQYFSEMNIPIKRVVRHVEIIDESHPMVQYEIEGGVGASDMHRKFREHIGELTPMVGEGWDYADNIINLLLRRNSDGLYSVGNAGFIYNTLYNNNNDYGRTSYIPMVTARLSQGSFDKNLLAHEIGHVDHMTHVNAHAYYEQTGIKTLMDSRVHTNGFTVAPENLARLEERYNEMMLREPGLHGGYVGYRMFDQVQLHGYDAGEAQVQVDKVSESDGAWTFKVTLAEALDDDVSFEVYTLANKEIDSSSTPYASNAERVTLYAGETEREFTIQVYSVRRYESTNVEVGVRYGIGVNADSSVTYSLDKNAERSDTDNGGESGTSGGSLGFGFLMLLMGMVVRRR